MGNKRKKTWGFCTLLCSVIFTEKKSPFKTKNNLKYILKRCSSSVSLLLSPSPPFSVKTLFLPSHLLASFGRGCCLPRISNRHKWSSPPTVPPLLSASSLVDPTAPASVSTSTTVASPLKSLAP